MYRKLTILLLLICVLQPAYGQIVFRSLEDAWKYADTHNPMVRTAKYEASKATYAKKQTYGALLPQVNAGGSFTDNLALQTTLIPGDLLPGGTPGSYRELQFGQQYVYSGSIGAQWNVLNLQNWYNTKIAKQTEEINKDSLANTRKTVYQQIATQYYSYLLMQEAYRLAEQSSSIADSVYQSTNNKFKEGTLNEANVDVSKLNLQRAQQNEISSRYQMLIALNNIKALLGLSKNDSIAFESQLQNNLSVDVYGTFAEDPELKIAQMRTRISLSQLRQANSAYAPTFTLVYNYTTQRFDKTFEPFSGARNTAAWFPADYWAIQASLPIFTGGSRLYQSKRNRLTYEESQEQYEYTKKQSEINDENVRLNYQKAIAVMNKAKEVMELSMDNYMHISYRYQSGIASIDDRLNAFRDYIDYQNQYLNSLSDMLVQLYQVKIRQQQF